MLRMNLRAATAIALWLTAACGGGTQAPSQGSAAPLVFSSTHFVVRATQADAADGAAMTSALEAAYPRILADLRVDSMPLVRVTLYSNHAVMEAATRAIAGIIPSGAAGLVTSDAQIHFMSPNAAGWGPLDRTLTGLVHEFAHCASLHINPRIANNPRWFWESVAVFEARESVDLRLVPYMAALTPPPFATLNSFDNTRVYDVGYSIAEFVVSRWGQDAIRSLILANGDTAGVLGITQPDFERDWFAFVRQRYGL